MHIAHIAAEMAPLVKVGGLGDVVGALPLAQARAGHQVTIVLPAYARVLRERQLFSPPSAPVSFRVGGNDLRGGVHTLAHHGVTVLLIEQNDFFGRDGVYDGPHGAFGDNGLRFGWFSGAALAALREIVPAPDVIVAHDWPAALVPVLMRAQPQSFEAIAETASALVIHNLAHQGVFTRDLARRLGIADLFLDAGTLERDGNLNMLRGAIRCATCVITVSPTYAREIVWPSFGEGLEEDLLARGSDLVGILNGIDTQTWDPNRDPHLAAPFDAEDRSGKALCKAALQQELGLRVDSSLPLFAVVSRVDRQKGLDLISPSAAWLVDQGAQLVLLGSGERALIESLYGLARTWKQSVVVIDRFDESLAHRIYAGGDFFLMPSRFEPCGLGQMVALRYGAIPIVRRTGGLADTVRDIEEHADTGSGIVFDHADAGAVRWACERALALWRTSHDRLEGVRVRGMNLDFSWDRSALLYDQLLERAVRAERRRIFAP